MNLSDNKPGYQNLIDLTGVRFGNLKVIERFGTDKYRSALWKTVCDCGKEHISNGRCLRDGMSLSCGCRMSFRKPVLDRFKY
jgi:hypothetical protein